MRSGHDFEVHLENYLKAIWNISQRKTGQSQSLVKNSELADYLNIKRSSVTEMSRKLVEKGFLSVLQRGSFSLTESGVQKALGVVRKHRIVEQFLHETLGLEGVELHEEAEFLEHAVSDRLLDRLERYLKNPRQDPQGMPIPKTNSSKSFSDRSVKGLQFEDLIKGEKLRVASVADFNPEAFKKVSRMGVKKGFSFTYGGYNKRRDSHRLEGRGKKAVLLSPNLADLLTLQRVE